MWTRLCIISQGSRCLGCQGWCNFQRHSAHIHWWVNLHNNFLMICFDQTHRPVGKALEDVTRPDETQARMWPVLTTICWKGVSYMFSLREHRGPWKGRLEKPSPFFLLTVASVVLNWHFLARFLQEATSTGENWSPCRLLATVVSGYQDTNLQTLSLRHSRVPVSRAVVPSERLAQGTGVAKITVSASLSLGERRWRQHGAGKIAGSDLLGAELQPLKF